MVSASQTERELSSPQQCAMGGRFGFKVNAVPRRTLLRTGKSALRPPLTPGTIETMFHSVILWLAIALQFWFMMLGMRFNLVLAAATLVMVGAAIGSIAQIPGIGGGFQAGFVFCLGTFFAVPAEKALAASLVAWVFSYVPTVAIAAIYMLFSGLSWRDLRGMETP